ncbi:MAG: ADP-ribosylation/Crystallin [Deltaproteobacteria bacterium]|nr:ADP-ribosylation/Crystallin [Deltaproteobacteria bacterium]
MDERILGSLWGAVVGDALGVPVEFKSRRERTRDPVTSMRGHGTFDLPAGSWSDDSSLMLCTIEGLLDGFDTERIGNIFVRWLKSAHFTPYDLVFDVGSGTLQALRRIEQGISAEQAGSTREDNNGNGSLMRILPVAVHCLSMTDQDIVHHAHRASSITHGHPRSLMSCGIYCLMAKSLYEGNSPIDAYLSTVEIVKDLYGKPPFLEEMPHFSRILGGKIGSYPEGVIESDGYVVHTLEAALWCLLTTTSYRDAVLKAVNLGHDTDTTAIVTGGLAGAHYTINAVPDEWLSQIARKDDIDKLFKMFIQKNEEGPQ